MNSTTNIGAAAASPIYGECIVDLFAGGGGASTGIEAALQRYVDVAVNHDPEAIAMHQANHPGALHFVSDVFEVEPATATAGRPVGLLWASPDCKHFSKAKGSKPVSKKIRALAWVVVKWASTVRPRVIMLENVEEFVTWGPVLDNGQPCKDRKGTTFQRWVTQLRNLGYAVEHRELRACDYGAPTIRKRLFLIARRDGLPIVWPEPTHGKPGSPDVVAGRLKPWRSAAECIDWSVPCPSIFGRDRPLAENTLGRIAKGLRRYVLDAAEPFIVPRPANDNAQVAPFLTEHANASNQRVFAAEEPLRTQVAQVKGGHFALVAAFLEQANTGMVGHDARSPLSTIVGKGANQRLVEVQLAPEALARAEQVYAFLVKYYGNEKDGVDLREPMHTIPTRDRMGLVTVTVAGEPYVVVDIGLRMLNPRELARAQGFPDSYIIDHGADGRRLPRSSQVRMIGNSVCPPMSEALARANLLGMATPANDNGEPAMMASATYQERTHG